MIRKLPNLSFVLRTSSKTKPWKVHRRTGRIEHVTFSPRLMTSRESFTVVNVGRYKHLWQAENAAMRSTQRHGGFAVDAHGGQWPNRPIKRASSHDARRGANPAPGPAGQAGRGPLGCAGVVGCEPSNGGDNA